jgi:hypothetical protein
LNVDEPGSPPPLLPTHDQEQGARRTPDGRDQSRPGIRSQLRSEGRRCRSRSTKACPPRPGGAPAPPRGSSPVWATTRPARSVSVSSRFTVALPPAAAARCLPACVPEFAARLAQGLAGQIPQRAGVPEGGRLGPCRLSPSLS